MTKFRSLVVFITFTAISFAQLPAGDKFEFKNSGGFRKSTIPTAWTKRVLQGNASMKVWLNNEMILGIQAAPDFRLIGLDYPVGANNEHLYGGGPIIGGIFNGERRVSSAYWESSQEFDPSLKDSAREKIWQTSATLDSTADTTVIGYYKRFMGKAYYDDDHDGKVDEDDLDGMDNDHDWTAATDDLGADGLPDSLEKGCMGGYDPVLNPDPMYDNYSFSKFDPCRTDASGGNRRMNDKNLYTQGNGIPDHGEPHVDEDFAALSDHDVYFTASDTFKVPVVGTLKPLGVKIWAKSYAFEDTAFAPILPFDYYFVNVWNSTIRNVYLGWAADMDLGSLSNSQYFLNDYVASLPVYHSIYMHNPVDRGSTPLAVTILGASRRLDSLRFVYQWWQGTETPSTDSIQYAWMNCEEFQGQCRKPDQPPTTTADMRLMTAFGPFGDMKPGDTLKLHMALITGSGIDNGPSPMINNIRKAITLFGNGFRRPVVPIPPCVDIIPGYKRATIRWGNNVVCSNGKPAVSPFDVWDDSNHIAESYPPDHWRRVNPPEGHTKGGRIFEGFRLYRSEDPSGAPESFTLLKEYDAIDEFASNFGIDTIFVDSNLVRGKRYWYAVTSFGIPNRAISVSEITPGVSTFDTLYAPGSESPIGLSMTKLDLTFSPAQKLGQVLVVPNPYRGDQDYTTENGGWEGRSQSWTENNRKVKFIHLPTKCTIRVLSLAGDLVVTLEHDDPVTGELEWDLLSGSQRALASGVYIYVVESEFGREVGKFVLVR